MSEPILRTLVAGGGGFIGNCLVRLLHADGRRHVTVVGRRAQPPQTLPEGVVYVQANVANEQALRPLLADTDEVIDLAYTTVPKTSFDDPVHDILANLPATVALLKTASAYPLRRFLLVSSGGTVYGNAHVLPIDESHPTNPISPYGITKLAAEKYAIMFHRLEGLPIVIARPGNPYGVNQFGNRAQGFIGAALHATLQREKVIVFGDEGTIRDYIYIEDLACGLMAALDYGQPGDIYNVGTGIGHNNHSILKKLDEIVHTDGYMVESEVHPARLFDVSANVLSSARLTYISGWRPQIDLSTGLARTWAWARTQPQS